MYTLIVLMWLGAVDSEAYTRTFDTLQECNEERLDIEVMLRRFGGEQTSGKFYYIVGDCEFTVNDPA